jgi:predicted component of type VI protein secretion system
MPAQLLSLSDGPSILLDKPVLLIGRHPECDIQIDSRKVSRRHCCIAHVNDYLVVRDLGSTNGVRINGVRVVEGKLRNGDELTVGNSRYRVRWDGAEAVPVGPPQGRAAQPVRSAPLPDEILEGAEDPVPLEDPDDSPSPPPVGRARPAAPAPPREPLRNPPTRAEPPPPPLFPDDLELAPASDVRPPKAKSHPPS